MSRPNSLSVLRGVCWEFEESRPQIRGPLHLACAKEARCVHQLPPPSERTEPSVGAHLRAITTTACGSSRKTELLRAHGRRQRACACVCADATCSRGVGCEVLSALSIRALPSQLRETQSRRRGVFPPSSGSQSAWPPPCISSLPLAGRR